MRNAMRRLVALTILSLVLAAAPARAQEGSASEAEARPARRLGLRETLALAVQQNPTLAATTVDVAIADAQIYQSLGLDDFVVDGGVSYFSQRKDAVAGQPFQQTALDQVSLSAGVGRGLSNGGRLGLAFDGGYTRSVNHVDFGMGAIDSVSEVYAPGIKLSYAQPFLRGFGYDVARAPRRRARAARDVATLQREGAAAALVRDVISAYWELSYAVEDLEIRRASLALAREQLRIVQAGIDAGRLARTASAEVEVAIAAREEEVLFAEQTLAERALDVRRLAGLEIGPGEIELVATDKPAPVPAAVDLDAELARALEQNPQLKVIRAQGKQVTIEIEVAENGLLPQLDFQAAGGPAGNADNPGDALEQMARFDSYNVQAGLVFQTPLGRRAARGGLQVAEQQLRKVKLGEADVRAQISVAVARGANAVRSAGKRIEVLAKSRDLALVNLDMEKARYEVGRTTNFEVLKRQDELAQAQLRQARARADYLKAVAVLEAITGAILERYGIELSPARGR